jgi:sec-independent protein translocase protein TatA
MTLTVDPRAQVKEMELMGTFSIWHWLIVLVVVLVLFGGRGKISQLMGDFGKGLKSFKKNMKEEEMGDQAEAIEPPKALKSDAEPVVDAAENKDRAARS